MTEDTAPVDPNNPPTLNYYTYCFNNPLMYTDASGNTPYVVTINKDSYIYAASGRGADLVKTAWGYVPFAGMMVNVNNAQNGFSEISEKNFIKSARSLSSTITEFTSNLKYVKDSKALSAISELSGWVGLGFNLWESGEFVTDRDYIADQLVDKVVGDYLASSTKEGVTEKYGYAKYRIRELVEKGKLIYDVGLFGLGNVTDYKLDSETQKQLALEFMLIDSARVNAGQESIDQYAVNYGFEFDYAYDLIDEDILEEWEP